jgi:hypothetical protein
MIYKIVVIDDERTFIPERLPPDTHVRYLRTYSEAALFLADNEPIDELWLDNDLGEPRIEHCGMTLANLLEEAAAYGFPYPVTSIKIHTANGTARDYMIRALRGYPVEVVYWPSEQGLIKQ